MKRILVVDPEPSVRTAAVRYLQREGLRADAAASTVEALARLRIHRFDAVLWADGEAGGSIADFHAQLRADATLATVAIVVLRDEGAPPLALSGVATLARPARLEVLRDAILDVIKRGIA